MMDQKPETGLKISSDRSWMRDLDDPDGWDGTWNGFRIDEIEEPAAHQPSSWNQWKINPGFQAIHEPCKFKILSILKCSLSSLIMLFASLLLFLEMAGDGNLTEIWKSQCLFLKTSP